MNGALTPSEETTMHVVFFENFLPIRVTDADERRE